MSWYNHFSNSEYESIYLRDVTVGDKFRMDKWSGKIRRKDVVMIKTSDNTYEELRSKKKYEVFDNTITVRKYTKP